MAWGGKRGISWGQRGYINKNTGKKTGFGDWRGDKGRDPWLMVGTVIGEQAKPWLGKTLWAQSGSGRAGNLACPNTPGTQLRAEQGLHLEPPLLLSSAGAASPRQRRR